MTTLQARPAALDTGAQAFIMTFMSHVSCITSHNATLAHVETLLLSALTTGDGTSSATWSALHRAIAEIAWTPVAVGQRSRAQAYLLSFVRENADLADE